jgi:hypothetical protein
MPGRPSRISPPAAGQYGRLGNVIFAGSTIEVGAAARIARLQRSAEESPGIQAP